MVKNNKHKKDGLVLSNYPSVIKLFITWKIVIFTFLFLGVGVLPLQHNFLGGGMDNFLTSPQTWAWANFDGEHYLSIAKDGYRPLTYFFFPLYPILISYFERFFSGSTSYLFSGLFVSHVSFLVGLFGLAKLIRLDYKESVVSLALILLLSFPTSFYFGSVYTESLFFALSVWCLYMARTGRYFLAGILGGLASATRITGLALLPAMAVEYFFVSQKNIELGRHLEFSPKKILSIVLAASGIFIYMYYLNKAAGDPLAFFHNLNKVFGEQRSSYLVSLPQVFYRYFFKILPNINYNYFPIVFTTLLELLTGILFTVIAVASFWKLRLSYSLFLLFSFLLPTFSGSFSSLPRYVLVCFPAYIFLSLLLIKTNRLTKVLIITANIIILAISTILYTRGYWLS